MRAIEIQNQRLVLTEKPAPELQTGEVLVKVAAAGVNRPDILQRKGLYMAPSGISPIPGLEVAGEVIAVAKGARGVKKGDKVTALVAGGGYAELCALPAPQCLPIPKGLSMVEAAGVPETFFTVWANVVDLAHLKKNESILIHGGASGIGTTAIQICRALGAKVFVTAGNDTKCAACKKLGAHMAINYKTENFEDKILSATKGEGVDVILDMVGGDYLTRNLRALKKEGRHISIAMQRGRKAEVDLFEIMSKRLHLTGSTLRPRPVEEKAEIAKALKKKIWPLIAKGDILPVIDKTFPLAHAQMAHDYLERGEHVGKVILKVT